MKKFVLIHRGDEYLVLKSASYANGMNGRVILTSDDHDELQRLKEEYEQPEDEQVELNELELSYRADMDWLDGSL